MSPYHDLKADNCDTRFAKPAAVRRIPSQSIPVEAHLYVSGFQPEPSTDMDIHHYFRESVKTIESIAASMARNARMAPQPVSGRWEMKDTRPAKKSVTLQEVK